MQNINKFYEYNSLKTKDVDILGSMKFGGLSNYWANQVDFEELRDLKILGDNEIKKIIRNLRKISKENNFVFKYDKKKNNLVNNIKIQKVLKQSCKKT